MEDQLPYDPKSVKPANVNGPAMKMALMMSGMLIVYTLVLYIAGQGANKGLGWINYILILTGLILASINFRDKENQGYITFGRAFYFGFMIVLFASLIYGIFMYIYLKFIAHDIITQMLRITEDQMMAKKLPEEQAEQAMKWTKKLLVPGAMAIMTFIFTLFLGTILSLISAAITKRETPPNAPPAV